MTDTVTTAMGNDNDHWQVPAYKKDLNKQINEQEKSLAVIQELNSDDNGNCSNINQSTKPIRILKRPTNQTQIPIFNDNTQSIVSNTSLNDSTIISNDTISSNIAQNQIKDSINATLSSTKIEKPKIKTYEQREYEYRLARLRIMGEEESSTAIEISSENRTINSTEKNYHSNLYNFNNNNLTSSNIGQMQLTLDTVRPMCTQQPQYQYNTATSSTFYSQMPLTTQFYYPMISSNVWYPYQHPHMPYWTQQQQQYGCPP